MPKSHRLIVVIAVAICIVGIAIFAFEIFVISVIGHPYDPQMSSAWENARIIQSALEKYSADHDGTYPTEIEELLKLGYLKEFPVYYESGSERRTMRNIPFSEHSGRWGDFSYWPNDVNGKVTRYCLCIYGDKRTYRGGRAKNRVDIDGDGRRENVIVFSCDPPIPLV
jgi:hypothetical protein